MNLPITKSARRFGYVIWSERRNNEVNAILGDIDSVHVVFNGFDLGEKRVDWKYHRISLGYKLTRALPEQHDTFALSSVKGHLEVKSFNGKK